MPRTIRTAAAVTAAILAAPAAWAACATDDEVAAFVEAFTARTPATALGADGSMEDARCTQAKLATAMESELGPVIGYKAGLTSPPAQERFGVTEPVRGVLYRDMMLEDGAAVPAAFGIVPFFEADLVMVVGSAAINEASTPEAVMASVSAIHPFIELPDLMLAQGQPLTGETITSMGVGPRMGVLGAAIPVEEPAVMAAALGSMTVRMTDAAGEVLTEAPGAAVLGHPAQAVMWLVGDGVTLRPGDLISVGSFGPLMPPAKAGGEAMVTYLGLPGDPTVRVRFTD
ncbi:2-keto-4-pentenoate hydratase [Jannaschia sp. LMIT008]|uniref:2-keto-4-pentenoate hydratase n=1 Tax=Jannaschia maritima TaxID=3032585 RepID=UPI0028121B3B|nr:fumarylacetoacetate hydrolase family protein [Jannaschia sp. LMIT008]